MSERGLAPYPTSNDLYTWARQLVEYLNNQARSEEFVAPRAVSLLHKLPTEVFRSTNDGILLYDPSLNAPVCSINNAWKTLALLEQIPPDAMKWKGVWAAGGYDQYDVVVDGIYLVVANTTTTDQPAPSGGPLSPDWDVLAVSGILDAPADGTLYGRKDNAWNQVFSEFHDTSNTASWRIIGNTLECWGNRSGAANPTINFPKTFARSPAFTTTAAGGVSASVVVNVSTLSVSSASVRVRSVNDTSWGNSTAQFWWHAIGEWDGVS